MNSETSLSTDLIGHALRYAGAGFEIFPIRARGKTPLTAHGHKEATTDEAQIRAWWGKWPDANIGLRPADGTFVLDADGEAGTLILLEHATAGHAFPPTPTAETGSGEGTHRLFRSSRGAVRNKARFGQLGDAAGGLDTRTHKGYIVAPPSIHPSGREYTWRPGLSPWDVPIAPAPDWLEDILPRELVARPISPPAPRTGRQGPLPEGEEARARSALEAIDPDCDHDGWVQIGMALHSSGESWALSVWDDWSRGGTKWREGVCAKRWASFKGGGRTMATLWKRARAAGWKPEGEGQRHRAEEVPRADPPPDDYTGWAEAYGGPEPEASEPVIREPVEIPRPEPAARGWEAGLLQTAKGGLRPIVANVLTILRFDPRWAGVLAYDRFRCQVVAMRCPPWGPAEQDTVPRSYPGAPWEDGDSHKLQSWLSHAYGIDLKWSPGALVDTVAREASFDPVREYLEGLVWDGVPRVDTAAVRHFGAEDTPYHRAVWRWMMIAAVARTFEPGCKADYVLILEGAQGAKKSQALRILANGWFLDTSFEIGSKDAFMALRGHWIVEMGELDSLSRAESTRAKAFFSSQCDAFRPPYGRATIEQPRRCVILGSTNEECYLKDPTGGRRYHPLKCGHAVLDLALLRSEVGQLWAEAVELYRAGERWYPDTPSEHAMCREAQDDRYCEDSWEAKIARWMVGREPFTVGELLSECMAIESGKQTRGDQTRAGSALSHLGCVSSRRRIGSARVVQYRARADLGEPGQTCDDEVRPSNPFGFAD